MMLFPKTYSFRSISVFYLVGLFDLWDGLWGLLFSSAGAYIIASNIEGPIMPWIGFVFLMGHMSVSHIHRQQRGDDSVVDVTGVYPRQSPSGSLLILLRRPDGSCHEGRGTLFKVKLSWRVLTNVAYCILLECP